MFVRKKANKSGAISVQVITKAYGKSKLVKTIGSSIDCAVIEDLVKQGHQYISAFGWQQTLDFSDQRSLITSVFQSIHAHTEVGTELLLGKIFNDIGFGVLGNPLFRQLVLSPLTYPVSKLKTSSYLEKYHELDYPVQQIYRYINKLHARYKELVQKISYEHTRKILAGEITVVFYDVTNVLCD